MIFKIGIYCKDSSEAALVCRALKFYQLLDSHALILIVNTSLAECGLDICEVQTLKQIRSRGFYHLRNRGESCADAEVYCSREAYIQQHNLDADPLLLQIGEYYSFYTGMPSQEGLPLTKWLDLGAYTLAYIGAKSDSFPKGRDALLYPDVAAYLRKGSKLEILCGTHPELCEILFLQNPLSFVNFHPQKQCPTINLRLEALPPELILQHIYQQLLSFEKALISAKTGVLNPDLLLRDSSSYGLFAKYYDGYMSHVDYDKWVQSIQTWFFQYSDLKLKKILEIACGTASIACRMVYAGYDVSASDKSAYMLHVADQKPFKPRLYQSDMISPIPDKNCDLVLCLFDSINYLRQVNEVKQCISNVYKSLRKGGLFIFDISTLGNSLENFYDMINFSQNRDGYIVHEASYEENTRLQKSKLSFFQKQGGVFSKHVEEHCQKVYRGYEIVEMIQATAFKLVAVHSMNSAHNLIGRRNSDMDKSIHRLFYILKKEN